MTLIEFLLAVAVVANVALQCIILIELRDWRRTARLRESQRRQWHREKQP